MDKGSDRPRMGLGLGTEEGELGGLGVRAYTCRIEEDSKYCY